MASRWDFDNPQKWITVSGVPLLDEHEITGPDGQPETTVDRHVLAEIARNNNRRVVETGDPAPLILGHTSDDPRAPEKPVKGFVVNYRVKPFKRDPKTGQITYAIHGDYKVRPRNAHLLEEYPRRSVELWLSKREIEPIAMLGGTTPERDLSVLIRKARLINVGLAHNPKTALEKKEAARAVQEAAIHYRARLGTLYRYAMEGCMPSHLDAQPSQYGDDDNDTEDLGGDDGGGDDFGGGDEGGGGFDGGAEDSTGEDPMVAKVLASKPIRDLMDKVEQIFQAVSGGGEPPPGGEDDMAGAGAPPMGAPPGGAGVGAGPAGASAQAPPPGPPGGGMGGPDDEAAMFHGQQPVRFEDGFGDDDPEMYGAGFGGPTSTSVPGTGFGGAGSKGRPFSRNGNHTGNGRGNVNGTQRRPAAQPQRPASQTDERVRRLERSNKELVLKLARADSEKAINALAAEGIIFGDTPEEEAREKQAKIEMLAHCDERTRGFVIADMRKNYRRAESTPATPGHPSANQYARTVPPGRDDATGNENDFEPSTPAESMEYAAAIRSMGAEKAVKFMRDKAKRRR